MYQYAESYKNRAVLSKPFPDNIGVNSYKKTKVYVRKVIIAKKG